MKTKFLYPQLLILIVVFCSCKKNTENDNPIILNTSPMSSVTSSTAVSGGNVTSDGGFPITAKGVVWSNTNNPDISLSTKTIDGAGVGNFSSSVTGLNINTTYYIRAYATNSKGTVYGNELSFRTTALTVIDVDGNIYPTVKICNQVWTRVNLNVTRYKNGDIIPHVQDPTVWRNSSTGGAWCYYNNDPANENSYGKLYNWKAVNDPRGLAPEGWHIPSTAEYIILRDCVGGEQSAGAIKEVGNTHWIAQNTGSTNSSGFTARPGGLRAVSGSFTPEFEYIGIGGFFWSTTDLPDPTRALYLLLYNGGYISTGIDHEKRFGMSVRCIKN